MSMWVRREQTLPVFHKVDRQLASLVFIFRQDLGFGHGKRQTKLLQGLLDDTIHLDLTIDVNFQTIVVQADFETLNWAAQIGNVHKIAIADI